MSDDHVTAAQRWRNALADSPECPGCHQSCTGSYAGKPRCIRCSSDNRLTGPRPSEVSICTTRHPIRIAA